MEPGPRKQDNKEESISRHNRASPNSVRCDLRSLAVVKLVG